MDLKNPEQMTVKLREIDKPDIAKIKAILSDLLHRQLTKVKALDLGESDYWIRQILEKLKEKK